MIFCQAYCEKKKFVGKSVDFMISNVCHNLTCFNMYNHLFETIFVGYMCAVNGCEANLPTWSALQKHKNESHGQCPVCGDRVANGSSIYGLLTCEGCRRKLIFHYH